MPQTTVLRGAQVIEPSQGLNKSCDLVITNGKISSIGDTEAVADAEIIDVSGLIVTPGWVDLHVHAYGDLGFAYRDYIGIYQGVTTFCEAGGPGFGTFPEFKALMTDVTTRVQQRFYATQSNLGLSLAEALTATYKCFLEEPFTYQIGLFLTRLERGFVLDRIQQVGGGSQAAA